MAGVAVVRNASLVLNNVLNVFDGSLEVHAFNSSDGLIGVLVVNSDGIATGFDSLKEEVEVR